MKSIILCAVATFLLVLTLYWLAFNGNPLHRIGFAAFISILPGILALIIARLYRFSPYGAVVAYIMLLVMTIAIQGWLR